MLLKRCAAPDSVLCVRVTAEAARRFLVARHALAPARSLEGGPTRARCLPPLGSIQFDPLAVAGRTHDLVLHARVADYDPAWCDLLYERREIFEAQNKGLSLVPASEFPWFRGTWVQNVKRVLAENADVAGRVLERIRADGPAVVARLRERAGATTDWFGIPTNTVRAVLEAYSVTGVLGLARRDGNRRYYDVVERLLPADVLAREIPPRSRLRHKLLSRYRAHGLLGVGGGGDIFGGIGPAKPDPRSLDIQEERLCARSSSPTASSRSDVESVRGKRFVLKAEVDLLERPPEPRRPSHSCRRSMRWCGTGRCSDRCSTSSTSGSSSSRRPSGAGAGTCCRCSSATASSAGSSRESTAPRGRRAGARPLVGGRLAPRRAEGFVDAMRDALRAYLRFGCATCIEWAPGLCTRTYTPVSKTCQARRDQLKPNSSGRMTTTVAAHRAKTGR